MSKVLVIGGAGFIGHTIVKQLTDLNHEVISFDSRNGYNFIASDELMIVDGMRMSHMDAYLHTETLVNYIGDEFNINTADGLTMLHSIMEYHQPEYVIHLANCPHSQVVEQNPLDAAVNTVGAMPIILNMCTEHNVSRFLYASSSMVYGDFDGIPSETAELNPKTLYGNYKMQCERLIQLHNEKTGLEYAILRPSAVYGERDVIMRVISKMTQSAIKTHEINVHGSNTKLDFTHVTDVASAFVEAMLAPAAANEIFNCTRGKGRTLLDVANIIANTMPRAASTKVDIHVHDKDSFYPDRGTLDSSKLQLISNWAPTVDIEVGVAAYVQWYST